MLVTSSIWVYMVVCIEQFQVNLYNTNCLSIHVHVQLNVLLCMTPALVTLFLYTASCSVWVPGPDRELWKQRYLLAWFIFFQDMVEHAIAEEIAGKRIAAPGVYLNEMPYPCYNLDMYVLVDKPKIS